ncbi:hypothetical protein Hanom_Chr10g00943611 [Helianthus anomalus]
MSTVVGARWQVVAARWRRWWVLDDGLSWVNEDGFSIFFGWVSLIFCLMNSVDYVGLMNSVDYVDLMV